jgi:GH24 family phage-related lysozyme (muramidase)
MLLKNGSTGSDVGIIQNNLKMLGYDPLIIDCIFGEGTENAVKKFQSSYELATDGIVGDDTWSKLISEIKDIQTALNNHGYNLIVDRIAGLNTYSSLIQFQELNNLLVDGIVGPETSNFLFENNSSICATNYDISLAGINFIADYESFYAEPYRGLDSQNQTIGYGHVIMIDENFVSITEHEAKDLLKKDLGSFVHLVNTMVLGLSISQNKFDALVSFAYNCGVTALNNSTLLKDIKAGATDKTIKEDFLMWCNCNGERALGLYRRRFDEFEIYADADYTRTYRSF